MNTLTMYRRRIARSLEGCRFKPSLRLCLFEEGYSFDLLGFLIALPFLDRWAREPHEMMESWGVYLNGVESSWRWDSIVWCWGDWCKFFHMPWEYKHHSWHVMRPDGTWAKRVACYEKGEPDGREYWHMPYRYVLRSGEVQDVTATVCVERGEWRRKCLWWFPMFAKVRKSIEVSFSDEVGEGAGSWKGGCVGCGYTLKPGETAEQCLRRMEKERKFNR